MHSLHAGAGLQGSHDYALVTISVVIAIVSAYAALDLGGRVTAAAGRLRTIWLSGGAVAMGTGVWSMHYLGMLAYSLPVSVSYHWPTVVVSLLAAVVASAVALYVVSRNTMNLLHTAVGGVLMGLAIAAMHYIGMAAMRLPARAHYDVILVGVSVLMAVLISLIALWLTFRLRIEEEALAGKKIGSAVLMGSAIPVMHYIGMAAVSFTPVAGLVDRSRAVEITSLGIVGIGSVTLLILVLAIATAFIDRRFSAQALNLYRSEERYRQLVQSAKVILWRGSTALEGISFVNQQAETVLGYPTHEWTSAPMFWLEHIDPEDRALARQCLDDAVKGRDGHPFEHRMRAADGGSLWFRTSIQLLHDADQLVGVMTDITDRKNAEATAEKASEAKSRLLVDNQRLTEQLKRENSRMSAELDVTRRLQKMILPREAELAKVPDLDIAGFMEPATEVGGDYYDVISKDGKVFFGIGDVTGHGLESGVIAIMIQTAVRTLLANGPFESRQFFDVLNRVVYDNVLSMQCDRNLTLSLLQYENNSVTISGQHEEIIVVRADGTVERHDTLNLGFPLGLEKNIANLIAQVCLPLNAGDVLVAYTDGITEAVNGEGVCFGIDQLSRVIAENYQEPSETIREAVLATLRSHVGCQQLLDDISMLVVKPLAPAILPVVSV